MVKKGIKVGSVTYAIKGRDILRNKGYRAFLTRNPSPSGDEGCGYVIYVNNADDTCINILTKNNIKIKGYVDMGDTL